MSRPYPHAVDAERGLLGALITDATEIGKMVQLGVTADDFYRADHGRLFTLLCERWRAGQPIDLVLLVDAIQPDATQYGGIAYVVGLPDHAPSPTIATHYAQVILDKAARRQLVAVAQRTLEGAHSTTPAAEVAAAAAADLRTIRRTDRLQATTVGGSMQRFLAHAEHVQNKGDTGVVPTGYQGLDRILGGGLYPEEVTVLAARPAMGKSALLLNVLIRTARAGIPVGLFSLEMGEFQIMSRFTAMWCGIPLELTRDFKRWNEVYEKPHPEGKGERKTVWEWVVDAEEAFGKLPIHLDYRPALRISEIRAQAQRWRADEGVGLIGADYLQLMRGDRHYKSREQEVAAVSSGFKAMTKELHLPGLVLAQLNRGVEARKNKRPRVDDLRESGAVEQDADVITFLYRGHYYHPNKASPHAAEVIVAKQRQGQASTAKLYWDGSVQLFEDP